MHSPTLRHNQDDDNTEQNGFSFQAAKAARLMPIFMVVTGWIHRTVKSNQPENEQWITVILGATIICLTLLAATFSLIALCGIPRHGARGLLIPALVGLSVPALVGAVGVPNFLKARETALQNRAKLEAVAPAGEDQEPEPRQNLESKDLAEKSVQSPNKFQGQLDAAGTDMDSVEQAIVKAGSSFVGQMKIELRRYETAARPIMSGNVLNASIIHTRADLQTRQKQIATFLTANTRLRQFIGDYKAHYRRQLEHAGLRGAQLEQALAGVTEGSEPQYAALLKIRDGDDQLGATAQEMLTMLDQHWGKWRCLRAGAPVQFDDTTADANWNALAARIRSIATEQKRLQQQVAHQL